MEQGTRKNLKRENVMNNVKNKLLVTASTFPRWVGDTEPRFVLDLCKEMNDYFDITVLVPACPGAKDKEVLEGIKVIRYHYFPLHRWETLCYPGAIVPRIKEKKIRILLVPFLFLGLWFKLIRISKEYDIVHAHWLIPQGIVQSFLNKPYIVTGHGGDVTSLNTGILKKLKIRALKKAKGITVVSDALKNEIQKLVPEINVVVRSMGCNLEGFGARYKKKDFFGQGEKKVVLFVGRLAEKKGVTYLIEAMKKVDAKLVIVGKGDLEEKLKEQARPQGSKIMFWGSKTHQELKEIYASADIFVAPSITARDGDKEGFGLVFLEAMASGLPVVGSNSGGIPDIVKDGYNGYLVEEKDVDGLAEKINRILVDEEKYQMFKEGAEETVKQYDYRTIAKEYSELLIGIER